MTPIQIHKIPAVIPLRLAVSWLEFLRELRAIPRAFVAFIRGEDVTPPIEWECYETRSKLHRILAGRILTGILLDNGDPHLLLRFQDATMLVNLETRSHSFQSIQATWMMFPGWLRITRVVEDRSQVILEVSGALFIAHIAVRKIGGEWRMVLQGGRLLAS